MIYQVHALVRLPGLTHAAFVHHWREHHAPLVTSLAADLRIKSYDQMPGVDYPAGCASRYDGFAIVGFQDLEDFEAMLASPEGRAAARRVREDEKSFFDSKASTVTWTREVPIL
ncbi:hypothetical protein CVO77_14640 [Sphingopyxis lindanitolerans]|uniref:EthD domain-containing protein n=1 Tax=Sphingopyxis lindanitolerans TaxID=2054227 RepID=A0A2S8B1L5_9SPHN|nr:EthD domain-containing protein [Sphingopyxis lindanitolerans]PQM26295.1 hypothetical protein CVO77_14640 [Sphingopyxis lindanitolerans]